MADFDLLTIVASGIVSAAFSIPSLVYAQRALLKSEEANKTQRELLEITKLTGIHNSSEKYKETLNKLGDVLERVKTRLSRASIANEAMFEMFCSLECEIHKAIKLAEDMKTQSKNETVKVDEKILHKISNHKDAFEFLVWARKFMHKDNQKSIWLYTEALIGDIIQGSATVKVRGNKVIVTYNFDFPRVTKRNPLLQRIEKFFGVCLGPFES